MTKVTKAEIDARKTAITVTMLDRIDVKLNEPETTSANKKKLDRMRAFFAHNDRALELLAKDNADTSFLSKQIYANDKLIDFVRVAVHGHRNIEMISPKMHHFMLRAVKTFKRLRDAGVTEIDYKNVIKCAMNGELKPTNNEELYMRGKVGYSSEETQSVQVMNVFKTLRIIDESEVDKTKRINLDTNIAKAVIAAIEDYDGQE